ncbi:MAG: threonylcarbamoyl-AMP synthase [Bacteroidia bacterium]|nr:threonylcarbamoyl-AMP synthase [Bacteroidia bacterium]
MTRIGQSLQDAASFLQQGELVGIPTETVYGLAANALDEKAVQKIFQVKNRPLFNPLIVHVADVSHFERYAEWIPEKCFQLAKAFAPGPLTFVLPKKTIVPDHTTGGGNSVALRIPNHPLTLELLHKIDFPLAAPSANPSGYISPVTARHVYDQLNGFLPYILDGGPCMVGIESTVVAFEQGRIKVLRLGGLSLEQLREVAGDIELEVNQSSNPKSPGQLTSHYAPRTPLILGQLPILMEQNKGKRIGIIGFGDLPVEWKKEHVVLNLSEQGSTFEAGATIFWVMRELDGMSLDVILAQPLPEHGLGAAVNDRLQRASAR